MEYQDPGPSKAMLKDCPSARSSRIERAVAGPLAEHPNVPCIHHVIIVLERGVSETRSTVGFLLGPLWLLSNVGNGFLGYLPGRSMKGLFTVGNGV